MKDVNRIIEETYEKTNYLGDFNIKLEKSEDSCTVTIEKYSGNSEDVLVPDNFGGLPVTAIEWRTFENCKNLVGITLPQSLASIESWAFYGCEKLENIKFPKGLVNIGQNPFPGCFSLNEINVDEQNPIYASCEGVLFDKKRTTLIKYPPGRKGDYNIPDSVITIGRDAFDDCRELSLLRIPKHIMSIYLDAFTKCEGLTGFMVDENNPRFSSIDGVLFHKEEKTLLLYPRGKGNTNYLVPDSVAHIRNGAFKECKRLNSITLPEGLELIEAEAFCKCEGLTAISLPVSLRYIGEDAFKECPNLENITLSRTTKAGYRAFDGFSGKPDEDILFDKNMTTLLKYPSGKKGAYIIPDSVNNIKKGAFEYCSRLTKLNIPKNLMFIEYGEFDKCGSLTDFMVNENNPIYSSIDGVLFDKEGTTLLQYPLGNTRKTYHVPGSVVLIREGAFNYCNCLTSIILPEGLKFIYGQFRCKWLRSITLPMSLLYLGENAFEDCPRLKTITLSRNTKMGYKAIEGFSGELIYRD